MWKTSPNLWKTLKNRVLLFNRLVIPCPFCYNSPMNLPLLQSQLWEKLQHDLKQETIYISNDSYTFLGIVKHSRFGNYLYLPYGPYLRTKNAAKACFEHLQQLSQTKNLIFVRIEPQDVENAQFLLQQPNCHKTTDLNPKDTWILDLTQDKEQLISGFSQGTRTRFNQFSKKGLTVSSTKNPDNIKYLVALQHKLAHQKKIGTFSENYLRTELEQDFATLYLVHYHDPEEKIISASLFFDYQDTRYYMQSATDLDYKKLPATVALLTTAIFDAKDKNLKLFDFWGIAPDDAPADHPWAGFTAFKKSFGGFPVAYAGTHDLVFHPTKYRFYQLARKTNRTIRKIIH